MNEQSREQQLVSAARDGDMDAFEALVHLYEKRVFALTLRMCGNPEDAAEAAHEAGLPCVGLTMGHTCEPQELVDAGCCALCDTVDDLRRVLLG